MKILALRLTYAQFDKDCWKVQVRMGVGSGSETGSPCVVFDGLDPLHRYHLHFLGHVQVLSVQLFTVLFLQSASFFNWNKCTYYKNR